LYALNIIAIVETWLHPNISTEDVKNRLRLSEYTIFRQDRGRRGGGILVAFRFPSHSFRVRRMDETDFREDFDENIMTFELVYEFNCIFCGARGILKNGFVVCYRRPGRFRNQEQDHYVDQNDNFNNKLKHIQSVFEDELWGIKHYAIVGDFNWRTDLRYDHRSHCAYIRERNRLYVDRQTHNRGGILDLIFWK
jgi:hypothetical protein